VDSGHAQGDRAEKARAAAAAVWQEDNDLQLDSGEEHEAVVLVD
jgi:hypothetical protein